MNASSTCPECGKPVASNSLQGLCPACMMKVGLGTHTCETEPDATQTANAAIKRPPALAEIAKLFPQLEILECLGCGGMGAVYKARQPRLDRLVALKVLTRDRAEPARDARFTERFEREARALAKLSHPNIVAVHEFGEAGGLPYLIMEYVDGLNLRQLERANQLSPHETLQIVPQLCEALQFAHDAGVVHRDIKPENILLDTKGRVKVADFGIARILGRERRTGTLTEGQQVIGTPHYMAPEQVEKPQAVDHRADIYSLGVVFYEMLTGELPLGKFAPPSSIVRIDVRLDEVVLRALEKQPERRYQQASEVKTDVETIAGPDRPQGGEPLAGQAEARPKPPRPDTAASPPSIARESVAAALFLGPPLLCLWFLFASPFVLDVEALLPSGFIVFPVSAILGAALAWLVLRPNRRDAHPARWAALAVAAAIVWGLSLPLGGGGMVLAHRLSQEPNWYPAGGKALFTAGVLGAALLMIAGAMLLGGLDLWRTRRAGSPLRGRHPAWGAVGFWPACLVLMAAFLVPSLANKSKALKAGSASEESNVRLRQGGASTTLTPAASLPAGFSFLDPRMEPGSVAIVGKVTRPDGAPAGGARVLAFRAQRWEWGVRETTTGADGSYELRNLPSGFLLLVAVDGLMLKHRWVMVGDDMPYDPRVEPMRAKANPLRSDFRLAELGPQTTTGRVLDADGQPVPGAWILSGHSLETYGLSFALPTMTDTNGAFTLRHPAGSMLYGPLFAFAAGHAPAVTQDIVPSSGNTFVLDGGARIAGKVRRKGSDQAAADLTVTLRARRPELPPIRSRTDFNGAFVFERLAPLNYAIEIDDADKGLTLVEPREINLLQSRAVEGLDLLVSPGASVSGKISVQETGQPIPGLRVWAEDGHRGIPLRETRTGDAGTYALGRLPAGQLTVQCEVPFVHEHVGAEDEPEFPTRKEVSLQPDESVSGVIFKFLRGATVSGHVTDSAGKPIGGARVAANNFQGEFPPRRYSTRQTLTDTNGAYCLDGFVLTHGSWRILVSTEGYGRLVSEQLPLTGNLAGLNLVLEPAAMISGRAVYTDGEPVRDQIIGLEPIDGQRRRPMPDWTWTDEDGRFAFREGAYPYVYCFTLNPPLRATNDPIRIEGTNTVQVNMVFPVGRKTAERDTPRRTDPALGTNAYVAGRVIDTTGRVHSGLALDFVSTNPPRDADGSPQHSGIYNVPVDAQGRFWIPQAAPGRYWVKVHRLPGSAGPTCAQIAQRERLVLTPGERIENLDVRILPPDACAISGTVLDDRGRPRAGVRVESYIPHDRHWMTQTDPQGRFRLESLNGIGRDPIQLAIDAYQLRDVPIGTNLTFIIPEPGAISGTLVDMHGHPFEQPFEIEVNRVTRLDCPAVAWETNAKLTRRNAVGSFDLANVPPGRVVLEIKVGNRRQWSEITVQPGQAANLTLTLEPPCVFQGTARFTPPVGSLQAIHLEAVHSESGQWMGYIKTDTSGAFRTDTWPAGEYIVRATSDTRSVGEGLGIAHNADKFYQTKTVRLEHGRTVREDFTVAGSATIRGVIRSAEEDYLYVLIQLREVEASAPPDYWTRSPAVSERVVRQTLLRRSGDEYVLHAVPPGQWELVALGLTTERMIPWAKLAHASTMVTVGKAETRTLNLSLSQSVP